MNQAGLRSRGTEGDSRLLRMAGIALPAAVWLLGIVTPPREGISLEYVAAFSALLLALVIVDQAAPARGAPTWRRVAWLVGELALCFAIVRVHGSLIRPALIYLLPASRALLMFGGWRGFTMSSGVWIAYGLNIWPSAWPDRLGEYPNYFSFFLAPYVIAVVLTLSILRQAADRKRLQSLYDELRAAHEQLQEMHERARELAINQERNRLAREIHDSLAHYLTVMSVQLEAAEKLAPPNAGRAIEQVRRARRMAAECLQEVRQSVRALRASTLDELSLASALGKLTNEFAETADVQVELELALTNEVNIPPETALTLYRAAQEGLTNIQKHASAKHAWVRLAQVDGTLDLVVADDGRGPPGVDMPTGDGFGLLGLRERVSLLGGDLLEAGELTGSRLHITVPLVRSE